MENKDMVKKYRKHKKALQVAFPIALGMSVVGFFGFMVPSQQVVLSSAQEELQATGAVTVPDKNTFPIDPSVTHLNTPEPMRAIYMSQCVVGTRDFRERLVSLIDDTPLNAVVIDIKDFSGTIGFPTNDPRFEDVSLASCGARDMKDFLAELHNRDIYTIARVTVFQDPSYTKKFPEHAVQSIANPGQPWEDHKGLAFVDVSSQPFWDYIVTLSKEAYAIGFDEINYDYIRYPSDGPMKDARYVNNNKAEALETFFQYLHKEVSPIGVKMSADLFGYTTVLGDDLGIGQQLERTLPYFDYVAPMVYPSHYNKGFAGLADPNDDPYKVVNVSMQQASVRARSQKTTVQTLSSKIIYEDVVVSATDTAPTTTKKVATGYFTKDVHSQLKLRPWLQDFDYGKDYTVTDITAQIKATEDAGLTSWFFWDPANRYENVRAHFSSVQQ